MYLISLVMWKSSSVLSRSEIKINYTRKDFIIKILYNNVSRQIGTKICRNY